MLSERRSKRHAGQYLRRVYLRRDREAQAHHIFQARQALGIQTVLRYRELFNALLDYYNKDLYRFEFKSIGARNNALKLLERNGFDYDLVEDLKGYMVQIPKHAKYAQILKNSVATKETANERIFLMKDLAAVEEAVGLGAKIVEDMVSF